MMEPISFQQLKELDIRFGTPFYIMDSEKYKRNVRGFIQAFKRRYEKVQVGYSFKTNYVPALCMIAKEEGCFAEVVSDMEYELAKRLGFKKIVFNGPIKRSPILHKAINDGAIINLDNEYEVEEICKYKSLNPSKDIKIGLRININLTDNHGNSTIQCGLRFGRFGFPKDILERNIIILRKAGVRILSLHGHTSSSDRAVLNYKIIAQSMLDVCEKYQLDELEFFDIGGGFFGAAPEGMDLTGRPTYEDYADCVLGEVLSNEWFIRRKPTIVIEPGSSVVSNVFTYYTKVYQQKRIGRKSFVVVDGSVFDVKPTMHINNLPHDVFSAIEDDNRGTFVCDVVGSTCMERDIMLKEVELPILNAGDYIQFRGVGAYTVSLTPCFINYLAPILMSNEDGYSEVRRRQVIDDIIQIYNY